MLIRTTKTPTVEQAPAPGQMIGPTSTAVEADSGSGAVGSGTTDPAPRTSQRGWAAMIVALVAIVGVATTVVMADGGTGQATTSATAVASPEVGSQAFLQRLAEQGYIPQQAVNQELLLLERLVASGDIPAATLEAPGGTVFNPAELLLIEAVASGQVPPEALDTELRERLLDNGRSNAASTARLEGLADRELGR